MASKAHNGLKDWLLDQLASADLRALLVVGTEPDADDSFVSDITEHPDRVRVALTNVTVTRDDVNDRASLTCDPIVFSGVSNATEVIGLEIYIHTGNDATSTLVQFHDTTNLTPDGTDITFTPAAGGIVRLS